MKYLLLFGALIFGSTSTLAAPVNLKCTEVGGTFVEEGEYILKYNGVERISYEICPLVDPRNMKYDNSVPDCRAMHLASSEAEPYYAMTIEFNWKTNEALAIIPRDNPLYFTVEETDDRYRMVRKMRPNTPQTYREGPYEEFTLIVEKPSLSFSFEKIDNRTKYDLSISSGLCLLAAQKVKQKKKESTFVDKKFFRRYTID